MPRSKLRAMKARTQGDDEVDKDKEYVKAEDPKALQPKRGNAVRYLIQETPSETRGRRSECLRAKQEQKQAKEDIEKQRIPPELKVVSAGRGKKQDRSHPVNDCGSGKRPDDQVLGKGARDSARDWQDLWRSKQKKEIRGGPTAEHVIHEQIQNTRKASEEEDKGLLVLLEEPRGDIPYVPQAPYQVQLLATGCVVGSMDWCMRCRSGRVHSAGGAALGSAEN